MYYFKLYHVSNRVSHFPCLAAVLKQMFTIVFTATDLKAICLLTHPLFMYLYLNISTYI